MPDFDEIERQGLDGVKIMIVNFPHMPTGAAPREGLFRDLVAFARRNGILLLHAIHMQLLRNEFHVGDHLFVFLHGIELHIHMEHVVPRFAGDR